MVEEKGLKTKTKQILRFYWDEKHKEANEGLYRRFEEDVLEPILEVVSNIQEADMLAELVVSKTEANAWTEYADGDHHSPTYGLPKEPTPHYSVHTDLAVKFVNNERGLRKILESGNLEDKSYKGGIGSCASAHDKASGNETDEASYHG